MKFTRFALWALPFALTVPGFSGILTSSTTVSSTTVVMGANNKEHVYRLDLLFDVDKTDVKPGQEVAFKKLADDLKNYPYATIRIEGHTDSDGTDEHNQDLSERRAKSVREYLVKNYKVPNDKITSQGFGERQPIATNDTADGKKQNRRIMAVVIRLDSPQAGGKPNL